MSGVFHGGATGGAQGVPWSPADWGMIFFQNCIANLVVAIVFTQIARKRVVFVCFWVNL